MVSFLQYIFQYGNFVLFTNIYFEQAKELAKLCEVQLYIELKSRTGIIVLGLDFRRVYMTISSQFLVKVNLN